METIGERLAAYRSKADLSLRDVEEATKDKSGRITISKSTVSNIERGIYDPTWSNLVALANLYGVRLARLVNGLDAK